MARYKPLPDNLTIKKSPIEGLGLFATKDIEIGENLGVSHIKLEGKQTLQNSVYYNDGEVIRTPLGGFINHSDKPNCVKAESVTRQRVTPLYDHDFTKWDLVTIKDIEAGTLNSEFGIRNVGLGTLD